MRFGVYLTSIALGTIGATAYGELPQSTRPTALRSSSPVRIVPVDSPSRQVAYDEPVSLKPAAPQSPAAPAIPPAQSGFDLAELQAMAEAHHPALMQAQARIASAEGRYVQAGLYPNPRLQYAGDEMGNEHSSGFQGGSLSQEIVTGKKRQFDRSIACAEVREAEQQLAVMQQRVLADVRTEFYNVLAAQRAIDLTTELLRLGEEGVKASEQLYKAKQVSLVDVLQGQVERDSALLQADAARHRHDAAWRRLAAVTGVPDLAASPLRGDLTETLVEVTWADALARVLSQSPEILVALAGVDRAHYMLERARREAIPNFDLEVGRSHDNISGFDVTGVKASFPIPVFNRNQGNIRAAEADVELAEAEIHRLELGLQARLASVFERYANARAETDKYSKKILPSAKSSLELVTKGYQQGEFEYVQLLTAQRTYFQTNLAYINSLRELHESATAIDSLLLGGSLGDTGGGKMK